MPPKAMSQPMPKLKFRRMLPWDEILEEPREIPDGYRMATVEEVENHFDTITRLGIPPLQHPPQHQKYSIEEGGKMYLLNGYMTHPSHNHFQLKRTFEKWLRWKVIVKEKEGNEDAGRWRTKSSAYYSSDGLLLRKHVYDHLTLSTQARQTAIRNCSYYIDLNVLYWLLKTTSTEEELEHLKLSFDEAYCFSRNYDDTVRCLLSSKFPFRLPLQFDSDGKTAMDYAIQFAEEVTEYNRGAEELKPKRLTMAIRLVELLVELFSAEIVHWKNSNGKSFLDLAEDKADIGLIHIFTKLLSVSQWPLESHLQSIIPRFQSVLLEAIERGYGELADKLLDFKSEAPLDASSLMLVLGATARKGSFHLLQKLLNLYSSQISIELFAKDKDQNTLFHYAAESGNPDVLQSLLTSFDRANVHEIGNVFKESTLSDLLKSRNKRGRMPLHIAAESGNPNVFKLLSKSFESVKGVDKCGKNILHCAAQGKSGHQIVGVLEESALLDLMKSRDNRGRTPLHMASSKGNKNMVVKLFDLLGDDSDKITKYVKETDNFGRTALQLASCGGHREVVKMLLQKAKWKPLEERDVKGKTTLHYAAQAADPEDAVAICKQLLQSCRNSSERSLLLWASAGGLGTADEGDGVNPFVKSFLEREKTTNKSNFVSKPSLLREAAYKENVEMAWELLNRGADIEDLRHEKFDPSVKHVLRQLDLLKERGRDQPSMEDKLGRDVFAEGLAALFLNRFIESPITVGVCGEWGMGKSSLMIQTEKILLTTAAQLTFPNLLKPESFDGAQNISLSRKGRKIYETIRKGAFSLLEQKEDRNKFSKTCHKIKELWRNFVLKDKDRLVTMLTEYKPQYHSIYKSLACMDSFQMLNSQQSHAMGQVPRILTVQYNAWQYHDQHEAWAGLAVTITKEIEKSMTRAQWFSTGWRYSWNKNNVNICFQVLLPCFIAAFLAGWIAWAAWILLKEDKFQGLKYGSIPLTIMITVWTVLKSIISVVKPVSVQMMGYLTSPDHTSHLGYQEQVISDINFLKTELAKRPHWLFSLILGEWCWNWFGLYFNNVENTCIMKFRPASEDQLRIITFVDDLDRCEEKVILEVLSAVNLVLARCKINVVLGIDKKMIERAIRRNFEDVEDIDIADKFMCKIIQIPISLPDPTDDEMDNFLQYQLGGEPQTRDSLEDDTDYGTSDDDAEKPKHKESSNQSQENTVLHIDSCDQLVSKCQSIIGRALTWLSCFLKISYSIACNISSELQPPRHQPDDRKMYPLTFSKGAKLTREMLITKYTEAETATFKNLKRFATADRKLPREWKRLFNYQRLAWNVLIKRGDIYCLSTWKVELVGWIFVCWQWKHEINTIIKGWSKYTQIETASTSDNQGDDNARGCNGPPLSEIVEKCVRMKISEKGKEPMKKDDDYLKVRGRLRQDHLLSLYVEGHGGSSVEDDPSQNSWAKLEEALSIQDVSMKGIQLFQQFRLHCETDHLPWPLPNQYKAKLD